MSLSRSDSLTRRDTECQRSEKPVHECPLLLQFKALTISYSAVNTISGSDKSVKRKMPMGC